MRSAISALLFDLDGTLTDPYVGISRCFEYAMLALGRPLPPNHDCRPYIGPPMQHVFGQLCGSDPAIQRRAIELYRERFSTIGLYENRVYVGIPEMLSRLHDSFRLYLCTSKPRVYAERILDHFGLSETFSGIYGSELDGRHTNKSELLNWLLQREHMHPQQAIMIGDRSHDIIAARENGVASAGVLWGYGSTEELRAAGCGQMFANPREITEKALSCGISSKASSPQRIGG